jgi:asparagine synthase (glutamine-hydrolysing)
MLELAARIPAERIVERSQTKTALKAALRPWLPDSVLYRPKAGFAMPLGRWMRDGLADLAVRRGRALDDLIDPTTMERCAKAHASGRGDATAILHSLHFLDQWLDRWR